MANQKHLYRKQALQKVSSPEQLDQAMKITQPIGWVALIVVGLIILAGLIWGIWGSVGTKVNAMGMIIDRNGIFVVASPSLGQIKSLHVSIGDSVRAGEVIGKLEQHTLDQKLQQAQEDLSDAVQLHSEVLQDTRNKLELNRKLINQQRRETQKSMLVLDDKISFLKKKLKATKILFRDGVVTDQQVFNVENNLIETRIQLMNDSNKVASLKTHWNELQSQVVTDTTESYQDVQKKENQVSEIRSAIKMNTNIISPYTGKVVEMMAYEGDIVSEGDPVVRINPVGHRFQAVIFASPFGGQKVRPGMSVQLSPSTVPKEEYGSILSKVISVSDIPASGRGLQALFHDQRLVSLVSKDGPPIQIVAQMERDPGTGRLMWTSSNGPSRIAVSSGVLCTAEITVNEQRPISLVIPFLKKLTGIQ